MRKRKWFVLKLLSVVFLVIVVFGVFVMPRMVRAEIAIDESVYYPVTQVKDGDTIKAKIGRKEITVRMLGIDTPETVDPRKPEQCFGREASDESKRLLTGKKVQLRLNPKREVKDKFGRYLAYVYLEDGTFVNEYMLRNGFAREYTFGKPYSMKEDFVATQNEARQRNIGLWRVCVTD